MNYKINIIYKFIKLKKTYYYTNFYIIIKFKKFYYLKLKIVYTIFALK